MKDTRVHFFIQKLKPLNLLDNNAKQSSIQNVTKTTEEKKIGA